MTTDTSADARERTCRWAKAALVAAIAVIAIGLAALFLIGFWYLADTMVSGADLRDRGAVLLPFGLAVLVIALGVGALLFRSRLGSVTGVVVCSALVLGAIVTTLGAIGAHPGPVDAQVIAVDPVSHELAWRTLVPLTRIDRTTTTSDDRVTVVGTYVDHGCSWELRAVTTDRTTVDIVATVTLTSETTVAQTPIPDPVRPLELSAANRSQPLICQH